MASSNETTSSSSSSSSISTPTQGSILEDEKAKAFLSTVSEEFIQKVWDKIQTSQKARLVHKAEIQVAHQAHIEKTALTKSGVPIISSIKPCIKWVNVGTKNGIALSDAPNELEDVFEDDITEDTKEDM